MSQDRRIGDVDQTLLQIEWRIADFYQARDELYCFTSPSFHFKDSEWSFALYPNEISNDREIISLHIFKNKMQEFSVEYCLGLKKHDGSVEPTIRGVIKEAKLYSEKKKIIKILELLRRKSEFTPGNLLTVTCTLKLKNEITPTFQPVILDKKEPLELIRLDKLSENFKNLFDDKESCDVTLKVKDKEYKAHRLVLSARSPVFAANFKHDTLERQTGLITIPDCEPDSFQQFLNYIYSGKIEEPSCRSCMNLYYTSDKYNVGEVKEFCVEYLMRNFTPQNICEIVVLADKYEEKDLFSAAQNFFNENVRKVFETSEWECLLKNDYRLANKLLTEMSKVKLTD